MAKKYIKSYSNYVLKTKHQQTNDGTIYERDITTIGGRDQFAKGQVPIYRTGNFVITTNNDISNYRKVAEKDWYRSDEGEIWTLNTLKHYEKDEKSSYDKKIVIKKDYFDLRDYAYYGSCSELMRVSIDDILKNYPGELFIPYETLYVAKDGSGVQYTEEAAIASFGEDGYTVERSGIKGYYTSMEQRESRVVKDSCGEDMVLNTVSLLDPLTDEEREELELGIPYTREFKYLTDKYGNILTDKNGNLIGIKSLSLIDNPFGINIHDKFVPDGANPLRYFAEGGINNYVGYLKLNEDDEIDIDGEWKIDAEHEYLITIEDIILDGLGEKEERDEFFNAGGGNCDAEGHSLSCEAQLILGLIAHEDVERITGCTLECIDPGKYIGKVTLCFRQIEYMFKTTPGLQRDKETGKPIEVCCDGMLEFPEDGGDGKYYGNNPHGDDTQIDSFKEHECKYKLVVYMFMGNNNEIKYLVEDTKVGDNVNFTNDNANDDCVDYVATANADFTPSFNWRNFVSRIRPNREVIEQYFNNLDLFERVLLNRDSDPIYTANFELIADDDYGMYTYTRQFTFPTTYGGWNLGATNQEFTQYVANLSEVGEYYDSLFTDNLWRSMTHESIKNFDWTYTRHYTPGEEEPFIEGGTKIQKVIRIYGREFDEVKSFIDAIDDLNTITYNNVNNIPDYFFTDKLEEQGWDVTLVHPLELSEFVNGHDNVPIDIHRLFPHKYNEEGQEICTEEAEKMNYFYDRPKYQMFDIGDAVGNCDENGRSIDCDANIELDIEAHEIINRNKITIQRVFNQKNITVVPYSCSKITTIKDTKYSHTHEDMVDRTSELNFEFEESKIDPCIVSGDVLLKGTETTGEEVVNGYHNDCGDIIKIYCDENKYTSADVNNEFMKRLILNSPEIWRHKGTIEGMEMLLSLFGLRSKNRIYTDDRYFINQKGLEGIEKEDEFKIDITSNASYFDTDIKELNCVPGVTQFNLNITAEKLIDDTCSNSGIYACDETLVFDVRISADKDYCLNLTEQGKEYYKNYLDKLYNLYDYDIKEYTLFTTREEDEWIPSKDMYMYDWVNSTKLISYGTADKAYETYQGLPISYREIKDLDNNKKRYVYPHFNTYELYDGNPYYQMDGGWMRKRPFMFDVNNNIITEDFAAENRRNKALFTETIKNIKCVGSLQELLSSPSLANGSGDICQVSDLSGRYAIIDGYVYPLLNELTDHEGSGNTFFYASIINNSLSVGNALFTDYVIISNPYMPNNKEKINLTDDYYTDREIKIYILENEDGEYDIDIYSKDSSISTFTVFENGKYMEGDNYTNYFRINDIDFYNELSVLGWQQLKDDEYEYYRLNTLTDYREGNNPHTGHLRYDNGHKYLTYFQKVFKHVIDNDLIDYRQYDEKDIKYVEDINYFGFRNLIDDDECELDYDKFLREDNKCHFFGKIMSKIDDNCNDSREGLTCFSKRETANSSRYDKVDGIGCVEKLDSYKITDIFRKDIIVDDEGKPKLEYLRYGEVYGNIGEYGDYDKNKIDNITDQIVNTKRMEIEFFIKNKHEYSKEWLEEVKYIDSVILPYLTQMIPSTVIWSVKYTTRDKEEWCAEENVCVEQYFDTSIKRISCEKGRTQYNVKITAEKK